MSESLTDRIRLRAGPRLIAIAIASGLTSRSHFCATQFYTTGATGLAVPVATHMPPTDSHRVLPPLPPEKYPKGPTAPHNLYAPPRVFSSRNNPLLPILKYPQILAHVLTALEWHDFWALSCSARAYRHLPLSQELKDVILARFVPGYRYCLRNRHLERCQDVEITMHDVDLLRESPRPLTSLLLIPHSHFSKSTSSSIPNARRCPPFVSVALLGTRGTDAKIHRVSSGTFPLRPTAPITRVQLSYSSYPRTRTYPMEN